MADPDSAAAEPSAEGRAPRASPVRRGATPLPQALALAPLLREVAGLALALESEDPVVDALAGHLSAAAGALRALVPDDLAPRMAAGAGGRVYLDHSHDIGAYNPCFPGYDMTVTGDHATGTVAFPLAFEGPPGMVHGGVLSLFFDLIVQQHNCELGIAGKTVSMSVGYLRPVPLLQPLEFEVHHGLPGRADPGLRGAGGDGSARASAGRAAEDQRPTGERVTSEARLRRGDRVYCTATVEAVAGDVSRRPGTSPRQEPKDLDLLGVRSLPEKRLRARFVSRTAGG